MKDIEKTKLAELKKRAAEKAAEAAAKKGSGKRENMIAKYLEMAKAGESDEAILKTFVEKYKAKGQDKAFAEQRFAIYKKLALKSIGAKEVEKPKKAAKKQGPVEAKANKKSKK